ENRYQTQAAEARVSALEQESTEQTLQGRLLEQRRRAYQFEAPISGQIVEVVRDAHQYVRAGDVIARLESARRHVTVNLPGEMVDQIAELAFVCEERGEQIRLSVVELKPNANLNGARTVTLAVPDPTRLIVGQTVEIRVTTQFAEGRQ